MKDAEVLTPTAQATTNSYADVAGSQIDAAYYDNVAIVIKNTDGADDLDWKVLASIDGTTFVEVQAEETLGEGVTDSYTTSPVLYRYYKVQVKSTVPGSHATAAVHVIAK